MKLWPSSGDGPGARKESRWFKTAPEVWQYVCLKHHITQDRDKRTLPFYYFGQLDRVLEHIEIIPVE